MASNNSSGDKPLVFFDTPRDLLSQCEIDSALRCALATTLGLLNGYLLPAALLLLGLPGNVLIPVVFRRCAGRHRMSRQNLYLSCLAVLDTLNLVVSGALWLFAAKGLPWASGARLYFISINVSPALCRLHRTASLFTSTLASNFMLLPCADRLLAIGWPLRFGQAGNASAKVACTLYVLLTAAATWPMAAITDWSVTDRGTYYSVFCSTVHGVSGAVRSFVSYFRLSLLYIGVAPPLLLLALNFALLAVVVRAAARRRRLSEGCANLPQREIKASVTLVLITFAHLLAVMVFVVGTLSAVLLSQLDGSQEHIMVSYQVGDIGATLFLLQECSSVLLYAARIPQFRHELAAMLCRRVPAAAAASSSSPAVTNGD